MPTALNSPNRRTPPFASDEAKWQAVITKDPAADACFCFSVKTTGVYCLPSCPSRRPLRKNVAFHAAPDEAERAGFRACKRCSPNGSGLAEVHAAAVARACRAIERAEAMPALEALAKIAGMSRYHFHRVFRKHTGLSPKSYATAWRAQRVRQELSRASTVTEAIYAAGFHSSGRFYSGSAQMLGMRPHTFRTGGDRVRIQFSVGESSLGSVLVAATDQGVCAISLGGEANLLVKELQEQFPKAELLAGDRDFERTVAQVIAFIEAPQLGLDLPLDIRGTAFQQRVWQALQQLPAGEKVSYTELAQRVGAPKSVRAVAGACAANTLAVAIPCHRVVRLNGEGSGYRWGIERKRALLERESGPRAVSEHSKK